MNKKLILRIAVLVTFLFVFTIGINRIYIGKDIEYISTSLVFYDLFMPYILGVILALLGKFYFRMNKNRALFILLLNVIVFIFQIVFMGMIKLAIATEGYVLISLCLAFVLNIFLLELDTKK